MKITGLNMHTAHMTATEVYHRRPSVPAYMLRALLPSPRLPEGGAVPRIVVRWNALSIDRDHLASFLEMTGLHAGGGLSRLHAPQAAAARILYPHVFGFPLHMALLTHRAFPLPIWRMLQVRDQFLLHRPYSERELLSLETSVAGQRAVQKGLEMDVATTLFTLGEPVWEGLTTYYFRGQYGAAQQGPAFARPLPGDWPETARWRTPKNGGWRFGGLTGDCNGIHWLKWYARRMGFRTPLLHAQLAAGQCLARLIAPDGPAQRLDLWLKGPVHYDSVVRLTSAPQPSGRWFALSQAGRNQPSIIGHWSAAPAGPRLLDGSDSPVSSSSPHPIFRSATEALPCS